MAIDVYGATGLIGGATGDLDELNGTGLNDGDLAIVITDGKCYTYVLDASSSLAEAPPDVIAPDLNPSTKRWILQHFFDYAQSHLAHLLYPSMVGGYGELYKNGWQPVGFNQRWGGPFGGGLAHGNGGQAWFPTGYLPRDSSVALGGGVGSTWQAQGFKVSETINADAVWMRLWKTGDPQKNTEPFVVYICPDSGGEPDDSNPIANGTMDTIDGPGFSGALMASAAEPWPIMSGTPGTWYRLSDASGSFTLTANTQYYIVTKNTGADATNNISWAIHLTGDYPHGAAWTGDDATPSTWVEISARDHCFLIESSSGNSLLQPGGEFDGMLEFGEGTPANESRAIVRPLKDFWNDEEFTLRMVTGALTASKTLLDATIGLLHKNRIRLYTDATPNLCLAVYESDGTVHSITDGATDVSSGTFDIMVHVRSKNDGSDVVELHVNDAEEGTQLSSQSISLSDLFVEIGHVYLGGGFPAAPTWTKDYKTDELANGNKPSNDGSTAFGSNANSTEALSYTVNPVDDTLDVNFADASVAGDNAFYYRTSAFVAATGGLCVWMIHPSKVVNIAGEQGLVLRLSDGVNYLSCLVHEYYLEVTSGGATQYIQHDFLTSPTVVEIRTKASDAYVYINGKLVFDGTGLHTQALASNQSYMGGNDITGNSAWGGSLIEWLTYETGPLHFEVNGCQLHEFAFWHGDMIRKAMALYNNGSPLSAKEICGIKSNIINPVLNIQDQIIVGATIDPTTTSTGFDQIGELEGFALTGKRTKLRGYGEVSNNGAGGHVEMALFINGSQGTIAGRTYSATANDRNPVVVEEEFVTLVGLQKFEARTLTLGGTTGKQNGVRRTLSLENLK